MISGPIRRHVEPGWGAGGNVGVLLGGRVACPRWPTAWWCTWRTRPAMVRASCCCSSWWYRAPGSSLEALRGCRSPGRRIRSGLSPRHVPDQVYAVPAIPQDAVGQEARGAGEAHPGGHAGRTRPPAGVRWPTPSALARLRGAGPGPAPLSGAGRPGSRLRARDLLLGPGEPAEADGVLEVAEAESVRLSGTSRCARSFTSGSSTIPIAVVTVSPSHSSASAAEVLGISYSSALTAKA